jgi:hypothetical protein
MTPSKPSRSKKSAAQPQSPPPTVETESPPAAAPKQKLDHAVAKRWTQALVKNGWTPVSDFFLENYHRLRPEVTSAEAMFIIQLMRHKRDAKPPYPGFKSLATRMGVRVGTARGYARSLETKKYLVREMREHTTNRFHLEPLFTALEDLRERLEAKSAAEPTGGKVLRLRPTGSASD